jgi:hypothetical protein
MDIIKNGIMRKPLQLILFTVFIFPIMTGCNKQEKKEAEVVEKVQPLNPNGDSELAILMRQMADEAEMIKAQIENGEKPTIRVDHDIIMTAEATEPKKKERPEYKAFAEAHIQSMELLADADTSKMLTLYDNMVNNCINCHKELCPGPLVRIKKLKIPQMQTM